MSQDADPIESIVDSCFNQTDFSFFTVVSSRQLSHNSHLESGFPQSTVERLNQTDP
jgi:hypothetical protein